MQTWTDEDRKREVNKQELAERLWRNEGSYCVSELVHRLAQVEILLGDRTFDAVYCQDELMEVCRQDDWQGPAEDAGWHLENDSGENCVRAVKAGGHGTGWRAFAADAWRTACEMDDLDSYTTEAYEHWLVSEWLAKKLLAKGEMVVMDFLGLTIWGRTCTGQSIALDGVMQEIAQEAYGERTVDDAG